MKKYKLIANPQAGRGKAAGIIEKTLKLLNKRNIAFDLQLTSGPGNAQEIAAAARKQVEFDAILSIGGDGTLNEIVQSMLFSNKPVGVIPAGSGNDFSKTLNTPKKLEDIIGMVLAGKTKVIDAGRVNERYFINVVGIGFDAAVNHNTQTIRWIKAGLAVYFIAFLETLWKYAPSPMRITIDGEIIEQDMFLVSSGNGTTCGGGFKLTPHAQIDDQLLDITMVKSLTLPQLFLHLPKVFSGTIDKTRHAVMRKTSRLNIESPHLLPFHADGEILTPGGKTFEISIVPKALTVIGNF